MLAGFALQHRRSYSSHAAAERIAWPAVTAGAVMLILMYPIMLGGFPTTNTTSDLAVFVALNNISKFLFNSGNALISFGLSLAFLAEEKPEGALPKWCSRTASGLLLIIALAGIGLLLGIGNLLALAPLGIVGYVLTIILGYTVWRSRRDYSSAEPHPSVRLEG